MDAPLQSLAQPHPVRFTVDEFIRLSETGVFDKYAKSELIEGEVWVTHAIHSQHGRAQFEMGLRLNGSLEVIGSDLRVYTAISVRMPDSLPEPDIVVAPSHRGVMPLDKVALAVEISDSTMVMDLGRKAALYAREGIPEYWVVDLENSLIHRHTAPDAEGYGRIDMTGFGAAVSAVTISGLVVETAELLD